MTNLRIDLSSAARMIAEAQRLLFFLHISPDGDSIGSTLAMVRSLRQVGKTAIAVGVDPVPRIYRFLAGWNTLFVPFYEVEGEWDLAVFLDCGDLKRVGAAQPLVGRARHNLNIDHHTTNEAYGEYNFLDFSAAAVGEVAYRLLRELNYPIDTDAATCIYTSIVTDTGGFRYDSTGPNTHRIAAELIELGIKPYEVTSAVFENESLARLGLLSRALGTIQHDPLGRVAWITVTREMMEQAGAHDEDTEGIVNYARSIAGVEVGLLFREGDDGHIRVNMRSRRRVDVGRVALQFGGGGHARAAGCTVVSTMDEASDRIIKAILAEF